MINFIFTTIIVFLSGNYAYANDNASLATKAMFYGKKCFDFIESEIIFQNDDLVEINNEEYIAIIGNGIGAQGHESKYYKTSNGTLLVALTARYNSNATRMHRLCSIAVKLSDLNVSGERELEMDFSEVHNERIIQGTHKENKAADLNNGGIKFISGRSNMLNQRGCNTSYLLLKDPSANIIALHFGEQDSGDKCGGETLFKLKK